MSKEAEYRRHAASLWDIATRTAALPDKFRLLVMADGWLKLADKIARLTKRNDRADDAAIHQSPRRPLDESDQHATR